MVKKIEAETVSGDRLELVRRGYDPYQVQRLVSTLSLELKALTAENDELRRRLNEAPRKLDANGRPIERRAKRSEETPREAELRENLRWARATLDDLLGQLSKSQVSKGKLQQPTGPSKT